MRHYILIDGAFVVKKLGAREKTYPSAQAVSLFVREQCKLSSSELVRAIWYDCEPLTDSIFHPLSKKDIQFSQTDLYRKSRSLIDGLRHIENFAVRLGTLKLNKKEWKIEREGVRKLKKDQKTYPSRH